MASRFVLWTFSADPKYGSAYRIGGRLVLTSAHILHEVGSQCGIRAKQTIGETDATVVWKAQHVDVALIELPENITPCESAAFGRLPNSMYGEKIDFQMYCWPKWGQTFRGKDEYDEDKYAAGGRQVEGVIYLADTSPDGLLVLEAQRLGSEWQGVSGAAVLCNGLIVAVQRQHQNPNRPASLEAVALSRIYDDSQWRTLLSQHGIFPEYVNLGLIESLASLVPAKTIESQSKLTDNSTFKLISAEINAALTQTSIFKQNEYEKMLRNIIRLKVFEGLKPNNLVSANELNLSFAGSIGLGGHVNTNLLSDKILVSLPVTMVGAIAVLWPLQTEGIFNLSIDLRNCNGTDVLRKIARSDVNAVVMPVGAASHLVRKKKAFGYFPLMLMPSGTYAIVGGRRTDQLDDIRILTMPTNRPSSSVSYCDELKAQQKLGNNIEYNHTEYNETYDILDSDLLDVGVAQWWPNYQWSEKLGYKMLIKSDLDITAHPSLSTFLFLREDLNSNTAFRETLAGAIRDSWLRLVEDPLMRQQTIFQMIAAHNRYLPSALRRCSGLTLALAQKEI